MIDHYEVMKILAFCVTMIAVLAVVSFLCSIFLVLYDVNREFSTRMAICNAGFVLVWWTVMVYKAFG